MLFNRNEYDQVDQVWPKFFAINISPWNLKPQYKSTFMSNENKRSDGKMKCDFTFERAFIL